MRRLPILLAGLAALASAQSQEKTLVVKAARIWVSPTTVRANAALVVERGVLTAIEPADRTDWPEGAEILEFPDATVTPGLVLAHFRPSSGAEDGPDAIVPGEFGADALDPIQPQPKLTKGGITALCVTPGADRLVSGQASVVRVGASQDQWMLKRAAALRVNVGEGPRRTPDAFKPPVLPGPDDPLPPAVPQLPKTRAGGFAGLRDLFGEAAAAAKNPSYAPREGDVDLRPFVRALSGALPVRIAADRAADITRAIELSRAFRLRLVIEGGNEAWMVAKELRAADAVVVLRVTALPPVGGSPQAPVFRGAGEGSPDAAARLRAAGVPFAIVPPSDAEAHNLIWHAARTLGPGFTWSDVLSAVTLGAARVLGVDADVGSIATGRRADFVVWPGDPLEAAARPVLVVAGGRVAHRSKIRDDLVAISVKRIHTCAGEIIEGGTVLVEGGKIRAVGQRVTIPHDARRVVDRDAVMVPGFVDGGSQVGLRSYVLSGEDALELGPPVGPIGMEQSLAKSFDPDMPAVAAAARAGVTAVALSPGAGRMSCGPIAVVKTAGAARNRVAKAVSGILLDLSGQAASESTRKQLDSMFEAGKKYADSFTEYEKALDAWKKGQQPAAAPREKLDAAKAPKARDAVSGTWVGKVTIEGLPQPLEFTITIKLEGTKVTGTIKTAMRREQETAFEGTFENGLLKVRSGEGGRQIEVEATVGRDVMNGTVRMGRLGEAPFEAARTEKPPEGDDGKPGDEKKDAAKKDDADDGRPKPPKTQPALEPFREIFADRASVFVACPTETLAEIVLDVVRTKWELRCVFVSSQEIVALAPRLAAAGAALAPTAASIREEEGVLVNPALIAVQAKIPVLFRTGFDGDPRGLYGVAESAVREGVDPEDALRMITRQTARFLGLLDRLGSIERGKDADLVLLSGEPFAPGVRVKRVMVDGRFVDEGGAR